MDNLRRRKNLLPICLPTSALLLILFFSRTLLTNNPKKQTQIPKLHIHKHNQIAHSTCEGTLYPKLCVSTLSTFPDLATNTLPKIISSTVSHTMKEVKLSSQNCTGIEKSLKGLDPVQKRALNDCLELLDDTIAELSDALSDLSSKKTASTHFHDLQTLLSGAMTNQYTCLDGLEENTKGRVRSYIENSLNTISNHVSNILVMLNKIPGKHKSPNRMTAEVFPEYGSVKNGFPTWVSYKDRRLLRTSVNGTKFDLVVAKDGTGNFSTISEAVAAAPNSSDTRFAIYIKAGSYFENVEVVRKKKNLMFVGDGIGKTVVKANRSVIAGWTTFRSATVAVVGESFIARGITFENYAGPSMHQAVALRSGSDFSTFYKCSFVGYQDTLYVHSLRQFYRDCDIYGTVDFIFGNAAVVFQNCNLYARKPNPNQKNIFIAQGREDPNQNTGISILNCNFTAAADLVPVKSDFKNYLGRPWKEYSRTVILKSYIGDLIEPAGWLEWNASNFALDTLYYGEYKNQGPGSNTSDRVTWPGYRVIKNATEANLFTVSAFIQGNEWLNFTEVPYYANLE